MVRSRMRQRQLANIVTFQIRGTRFWFCVNFTALQSRGKAVKKGIVNWAHAPCMIVQLFATHWLHPNLTMRPPCAIVGLFEATKKASRNTMQARCCAPQYVCVLMWLPCLWRDIALQTDLPSQPSNSLLAINISASSLWNYYWCRVSAIILYKR